MSLIMGDGSSSTHELIFKLFNGSVNKFSFVRLEVYRTDAQGREDQCIEIVCMGEFTVKKWVDYLKDFAGLKAKNSVGLRIYLVEQIPQHIQMEAIDRGQEIEFRYFVLRITPEKGSLIFSWEQLTPETAMGI